MSACRPDPAILQLGPEYYDPVSPADFPQAILRFRNQRQAEGVGLGGLSDEDWIRHFGRFAPLPDNLPEPLALRYHGHQFRVYNPDIGDGRGFLFAQVRDGAGRLLDLGTKGSGQTPYSRFGDGRLTLKGGVRELLATEMLEALGVETSKTFSLIETGEALERNDEPSPTRGAVLVRLQHSHIRIGTFQRLATLGEADNIRKLTDYCLRHYYPEARHCEDPGPDPRDAAIQPRTESGTGLLRSARSDGEEAAALLLGAVTAQAAKLAASYIAAGFVHGVLNSDNIAITAQSFDYGPWRFTPFWDGHFTAAYFDHQGLYSFGRQPEAIHWDLVQLALSLRTIAEADALTPRLETFPHLFQEALRDALFARLGIVPAALDEDMKLVVALEEALARKTVEIDRFFFDWRGGLSRQPDPSPARSLIRDAPYKGTEFDALRQKVRGREPVTGARDHSYWSDPGPCSMHIEEVEAIWAAIDERDDWAPLHAKLAAVRRMGEALTHANA
ncbi:MAG TPA: YdiU family protein [Allosphingosinicella sp.]|nr:YdiU family protein [Allosphingosinicella sp.]